MHSSLFSGPCRLPPYCLLTLTRAGNPFSGKDLCAPSVIGASTQERHCTIGARQRRQCERDQRTDQKALRPRKLRNNMRVIDGQLGVSAPALLLKRISPPNPTDLIRSSNFGALKGSPNLGGRLSGRSPRAIQSMARGRPLFFCAASARFLPCGKLAPAGGRRGKPRFQSRSRRRSVRIKGLRTTRMAAAPKGTPADRDRHVPSCAAAQRFLTSTRGISGTRRRFACCSPLP